MYLSAWGLSHELTWDGIERPHALGPDERLLLSHTPAVWMKIAVHSIALLVFNSLLWLQMHAVSIIERLACKDVLRLASRSLQTACRLAFHEVYVSCCL